MGSRFTASCSSSLLLPLLPPRHLRAANERSLADQDQIVSFFLRRRVVRGPAGLFFFFFSAAGAGRGVSANFQRLLWLVYD